MKIIRFNYTHLFSNAPVLTPLSPSPLQVTPCGHSSFLPRMGGTRLHQARLLLLHLTSLSILLLRSHFILTIQGARWKE